MVKCRVLILLVILGIAFANDAKGQSHSDTLEVYFRQSYSTWDPQFKDNGKNLQQFIERYRQYQADNILNKISKINIISGCSPEGLWRCNQTLSKNRTATMRRVLADYMHMPDSVIVEKSLGINWADLREMVVADPNMPYKEEVLEHIDNSPEIVIHPDGRLVETRKLRLMYLKSGIPWRYMYEKFFPALRSFNMIIAIEWEKLNAVKLEVRKAETDTIPLLQYNCSPTLSYVYKLPPREEFPPREEQRQEESPFYMAVKTNLLYDAAITPNLGVEFYLGKNWTLSANWMYAWWKNDTRSWYWRIYGGDLGLRKWFGSAAQEKPLTGHHLGIYGQMLTYDFEFGGRGYMGGLPEGTIKDRAHYAAGVEYGYALPIGKRLNLDFTIGAGYMSGEYREYIPIDNCYVWQVTKQRHWFGPTKAEISLVWLLGRGNINKGKGGER